MQPAVAASVVIANALLALGAGALGFGLLRTQSALPRSPVLFRAPILPLRTRASTERVTENRSRSPGDAGRLAAERSAAGRGTIRAQRRTWL
jgi:hypothetical protein